MKKAFIFLLLLAFCNNALAQTVAFPGPGGKSNAPPVLTYQTTANDATDLITYTYTGQSIGPADPTRKVIVCVTGSGSGSNSISSATIGGISATVTTAVVSGTVRGYAGIIIASVPTGTTATIVINFNATFFRSTIGVWSATNLSSSTPTATATGTTTTSGQAENLNLNVTTNDVVVGCSYDNADNFPTIPTVAWIGATQRYSAQTADGDPNSGADYTATSTQTPRTITSTWTTSTRGAGAAAAFR